MKIKLALVVAIAAVGVWWLLGGDGYVPRPLPPLKPSSGFQATVMVPTLEMPIPAGRNAVWCGAFQLAWRRMASDVAKEPLALRGLEPLCKALNASAFGEGDLTPESFYAAAGFAKDGIVPRIHREMGERFPGVKPNLPEVPDLKAMAYAYLAAGLRFKHPYFDRKEGIAFTEASGRATQVRGFGLRSGDNPRDPAVYRQPLVLHVGKDPMREFVVDLDQGSAPQQIVLAMLERPASLAQGVTFVEDKLTAYPSKVASFARWETLAVPEIVLGVLHRFKELEGPDKPFLNPALQGTFIEVAQQSVQFRLDRGGAELKAEAVMAVKAALPPQAPLQLIFDRPFLLLMKRRGAARPYLALWIDNPEILELR